MLPSSWLAQQKLSLDESSRATAEQEAELEKWLPFFLKRKPTDWFSWCFWRVLFEVVKWQFLCLKSPGPRVTFVARYTKSSLSLVVLHWLGFLVGFKGLSHFSATSSTCDDYENWKMVPDPTPLTSFSLKATTACPNALRRFDASALRRLEAQLEAVAQQAAETLEMAKRFGKAGKRLQRVGLCGWSSWFMWVWGLLGGPCFLVF